MIDGYELSPPPPRGARAGLRVAAVLAVAALAAAGCTSGKNASAATGPSCLDGPVVSAPAAPTSGGKPVPTVALKCFTGNGEARLDDLRAPAVVTLWQSACTPCAQEAPAFQTLAEQTAGRLRVIGVDTADVHTWGQSFVDDHRLTFPMLQDYDKLLLSALGQNSLPVTVFLTADGRIAHLYNASALSLTQLTGMTRQYLGVTG